MTAAAAVAERLRARCCGAGWIARCPAHADRTPSLSLREGRDGRVLLRCHAGCATADVLAAAGLTWRDVCGDSRRATRADLARLGRARDASEAADAARRRSEREARAAECDGWAVAQRLADRLAALTWRGAAEAAPGGADALVAQYHALLDALRATEVAHVA